MITPQLKDSVLNSLIQMFNNNQETFNYAELAEELGSKEEFVFMILLQFKKTGIFHEFHQFIDADVSFSLSADAFDLHHLGGFTAKEEILKLNLQKLNLEIESLKQTEPDTAEKISSILTNITTVAAFLFK